MRPIGLAVTIAFNLSLLPLASEAQDQIRPLLVGVLNNSFTPGAPVIKGLKAGLKTEGIEEGRDVRFDIRSTGSDERAAVRLAAALATDNPAVIITVGEKETKAASVAAPRTPIVFTQLSDPLGMGLVASIARPGGRLTGVTNLFTELVPKRLELAKELVPNLRRVFFVYDAQDPASMAAARGAQETAARLKMHLVVRPVRTRDEAVRELKTVGAGDVLLTPATVNLDIVALILNLNLYGVAPAIFHTSFWVQAGGAASYGIDTYAEGVQAARLVAKILRGARPEGIPVEGVNKIEVAINRKTVHAFGLTIPAALMARVDRIFEGIGE
jgi:putative tryptophan/tyrosine transport system substrate-binding protein